MTKEDFIKKAIKVHGDKYSYDDTEYINYDTKLKIKCRDHGYFWQTPGNHLRGKGCPYCSGNAKMTKEIFIERAKKIWGDEFDYSKVNYINNSTPVTLIDKNGKEYMQSPANHLYGFDCRIKSKPSTKNFIIEANKIHNGKYDYSKVDFVSSSKKVCIVCPEHGEFWQLPHNHLKGEGCPKCKQKSTLENFIKSVLLENGINFEEQKRFEWLGKKSLDFYIKDKNLAIECQGKEHLYETGQWETFETVYRRDIEKYDQCSKNGVKLIYVKSKRDKKVPEFYNDKIIINSENFFDFIKNEK